MRHTFTISIGDWSGDGHDQQKIFYATAAKPIEAVREAYFAAVKKHPNLSPEELCSEYRDSSINRTTADELRAAGCPLPDFDSEYDEPERLIGMNVVAMAEIVVWFLNQGDPDLDARLKPAISVPMLPFYGYDERDRHIGHIGYGLF